ncbi:hypothetical protein ACIBH1_18935 [Nonomuraea sp. NPDC050663]|uniref:hypothetical protein n=1 Tax=Nonomuraea sp. NPDC050663 TaxID=3364370 RepID=UPI00379D5B13
MLTTALGAAWLLLAPVALWFLIRGRALARVAAVLGLGLLEAGTIVLTPSRPAPVEVVASPVTPAVRPAPAPAVCAERRPVPSHARIAGSHLTLAWTAAPDECGTALVMLRHKGRKLRVWVHEGPLDGHHTGVRTAPVRVTGGQATVRLAVDVPPRTRTLDGRTDEVIPH